VALLTPVPVSPAEFGELVALLINVTVPRTIPVAFGANTTFNSAVCPAATVLPLTPLVTLNPVPVTLIWEMVRLEFPVFLIASCSGLVPPTISFPKFRLEEPSEIVLVALAPVPLNAMVYVAFVALLLMVTVPVTLPEADGPNATVKLDVCPADSVLGKEIPLSLNPVPLTVMLEMVTLLPPVFFNCTVCEFVVPSATVPKLTLDGVVVTVPGAVTPVPLTEYSALPLVALLVNNTYPECSPVLVGANFTESVMYPPAEIVCGTVNPLTLNPVACTDSAEIVAAAAPVFFMVNVMVLPEPTLTDPKLPGDGLNDNVPCVSSPRPSVAPGEKKTTTNSKQRCTKYRLRRCQRPVCLELVSGKTVKKQK